MNEASRRGRCDCPRYDPDTRTPDRVREDHWKRCVLPWELLDEMPAELRREVPIELVKEAVAESCWAPISLLGDPEKQTRANARRILAERLGGEPR